MATTVATIWRRVKDDPTQFLDPALVLTARAKTKHHQQLELFRDPAREGKLSTYLTLAALIIQALHGNTALSALGRLTGVKADAGSFCRARQRLPLELLRHLANEMATGLMKRTEKPGLWKGLRVLALDATTFSMPDTATLANHFGKPSNAGPKPSRKPTFPFAHALAMLDIYTGLIIDVVVGPGYTHDLHGCPKMQRRAVGMGDLLLGDRHFGTVAHIALAVHHGLHAAMRVTESGLGVKRDTSESGIPRYHGRAEVEILLDRLINLKLTDKCPVWMDPQDFAKLGERVRLRKIVYVLRKSGYRSRRVCLYTTLLDETFCSPQGKRPTPDLFPRRPASATLAA